MKKISNTMGVLVLLASFLLATGCANKRVAMEIDYGEKRQSRQVEAKWQQGITALEALKSEAEVKTHQVGKHLFVTSIDGVEGERGVMAWYYEINGNPAKKLAVDNLLDNGDKVKWTYRKDVCSPKADN